MNCPRDVPQESFRKLLQEVPRGFVLTRTVRIGDARYFHFDMLAKEDDVLKHYALEVPIYCKPENLH